MKELLTKKYNVPGPRYTSYPTVPIGTALEKSQFGTADNPIKMMEADHEEAGEVFRKIAKLTNNYNPPAGACNTYRAFYSKLEEFEQDLHQHVHLENNILFPKALKLEKELFS